MGLMNCKIHGMIGVIPYVSKKLCRYILSNERINFSEIKSIHTVFFDEGEILFDRYYFFDANLFNYLNLKEYYEIITDEDESNFKNLTQEHLSTVCVSCFKEYMNKIGYNFKL